MDEIQRIILEVQNREKLEALNAELAKEQAALKELSEQLRTGAINQSAFGAAAQGNAQAIARLNGQVAELEKSTGRFRTGSLMQLSYVMDDLTNTTGGWERKLASISNNIPGLAAALGASGGLAGAIGILSTALIALAPLAAKAWEALSGGEAATTTADTLERLADKAKGLRDELEKILKSQGSGEKETQKLFEEFTAGKGQKLLGGIASTLATTRSREFMTDQERMAFESVEHARPDVKARVQASVMAEVNKRALERAGQLLGRAPTERGARDTIRALAAANPGAFPKGFAGDLASIEPEEIERSNREIDENLEAGEESGRALARQLRKRRAADKKHDQFRARLQHEQTDAVLHGHAQAIREREKAEAAEGRATERDDAINLRAYQQAKKTAPFRQERAVVARTAAAAGFTGQNAPSAEQLDEMAHSALGAMRNGLTGQEAAMQALFQKVKAIQDTAQRWQAMQARQQMGPDFSGNFSLMTPYF